MQYDRYSDEELLDVYRSMSDYSGKADGDLLDSIDRRGGLEQLQQRVAARRAIPHELRRIQAEAARLAAAGAAVTAIKEAIRSELLSREELDAVLGEALQAYETQAKQNKWTARLVLGCLAGWAISSLLGAILWVWIVVRSGKIYYGLSVLVVLAGYGICRLLAGRKHFLVFVAAFLAGCTAIVLGLWACAQLLTTD